MAEQLSHQQDVPHNSMSGGIDDDAEVLDYKFSYLARCVRYAQSHGIFPESDGHQQDGSQQDEVQQGISHPYDSLGALPQPLYQNHSTLLGHQFLDHDPSDGNYSYPHTSSFPANPDDAQYNYSNQSDPFSAPWNNDVIFEDGQIDNGADYLQHHTASPSASIFNPMAQGSTPGSGPPSSHSLEEPDPTSQMSSRDDISTESFAVRHNYDPLWVQEKGREPESVFEPRARMKFDKLFYEGVIQKGDRLMFAVAYKRDGVVYQDVAILTHTGSSKLADKSVTRLCFPNFDLTLRDDPNYRKHILACTGTNDIVDTFRELKMAGPGPPINPFAASFLYVWRGDRELGSLEYVNQVYHVWNVENGAEYARIGIRWRFRFPTDRKKTVSEIEYKTEKGKEQALQRFLDGVPRKNGLERFWSDVPRAEE